jgi:hypothetical protein
MTGAPDNPTPSGCANCGALLTGPWCARCGQEAVGRASLRRVARRQYERIRHSLLALVFHPGQLTAEFRDGQRARSISPWRLALNLVAFFFALSFITDFRVAHFAQQDPTGTLEATIAAAAARSHVSRAEIAERIDRRLNGVYTLLLTLSVACNALLARVLHRRRPAPWSVHGVFALHLVAWTFLLSVLYFLMLRVLGLSPLMTASNASTEYANLAALAVVILLQIAYVLVAFHRVYADTWRAAGVKAVLLVIAGVFVDNAVLALAFLIALKTV